MTYTHIIANNTESHDVEGGERISILASGADINHTLSIYDSHLPQGLGAPWHIHAYDEEIFYIIAGEVEFGVHDENIIATTGDLVIVSPKTPRRFQARTERHLLIINTPAGPSEGFIREISQLLSPPTEEDRRRFIERYGIHIL